MAPTKEPSQPLHELPLIEQIDMILAANGNVPQRVKDRLMFSVVKSLIIAVGEIQEQIKTLNQGDGDVDKRIKTLEGRNIVTWCINHPVPATFIIVLVIFLLFSHYGTSILDYFGITLP